MLLTLISPVLLCLSAATSSGASPDPLAVAFGTMPALWGVRLSPDGSKVSFLQMHPEDLPVLRVLDLTTGQANRALASTRDGFDLRWCNWANGERLLCSLYGISRAWKGFGMTRLAPSTRTRPRGRCCCSVRSREVTRICWTASSTGWSTTPSTS